MDEEQYASFGRTAFGSVSGSKLARIRQYAGHTILDVGCGPGLYLEKLTELGYEVAGVDANSIFVEESRKFTNQVYQMDLDNEGLSQFPPGSFDTVLMLDVLEHVANDLLLLYDAVRVARKNILLSVPAQVPKEMWGSQLVFASYVDPTHLRYYSFEDLQNLLRQAGLRNFQIISALGITPVIYSLFPWYLKSPLKFLNRILRRVIDPKLITSVWFAVGWKADSKDLFSDGNIK